MTFRRTCTLLTVVAAAVTGLSAQSASSLVDRAAALHRAAPALDGPHHHPQALREEPPARGPPRTRRPQRLPLGAPRKEPWPRSERPGHPAAAAIADDRHRAP